MKKNIIALILFAVIIAGVGASIVVLKNDNAKYTLNYTDNNHLYIVKLYENKIEVHTKENDCSNTPCKEVDKSYKIKFSENKTDKIYETFEDIFKDKSKTKDLNSNTISSEEKKVLTAIITNNPDEIEEESEKPEPKPEQPIKELLFSLKSNRVNCQTILVKVYKDKTYEVFAKNIETPTTSGHYAYDVSKIISNANKYEKTAIGPFILTDENNNQILLYDNNKELQEFLSEIKVNLDTCMDFQN